MWHLLTLSPSPNTQRVSRINWMASNRGNLYNNYNNNFIFTFSEVVFCRKIICRLRLGISLRQIWIPLKLLCCRINPPVGLVSIFPSKKVLLWCCCCCDAVVMLLCCCCAVVVLLLCCCCFVSPYRGNHGGGGERLDGTWIISSNKSLVFIISFDLRN